MSGKPGRSGRKHKVKEGTEFSKQKAIEAQQALRRMQLIAKDEATKHQDIRLYYQANKDVYQAEYGTPPASIEQRIKANIGIFTPDDYALIGQQSAREKTFLKDYTPQLLEKETNATKQEEEQGEDEGIQVARPYCATRQAI